MFLGIKVFFNDGLSEYIYLLWIGWLLVLVSILESIDLYLRRTQTGDKGFNLLIKIILTLIYSLFFFLFLESISPERPRIVSK